MFMTKYIISALLLATSFSFGSPFAFAQTTDVDTTGANSCAIISINLRYLSRDVSGGTDVSILQDFLNGRGYLKSQPTGFFGSATRRAVIAFQNDNGLRATPPGFVGPATRAKIQAIDCSGDSATNATPVAPPVIHNDTPKYTAPQVTSSPTTLTVDFSGVVANKPILLTWTSTGTACSLAATNDYNSNSSWAKTYLPASGSLSVTPYPLSASSYVAQYQITCSGQNAANNTASVSVVVNPETVAAVITAAIGKDGKDGLSVGDGNIIYGKNFKNVKEVYLMTGNGTRVSVIYNIKNDTTIDIVIPPVEGGYYTVQVVNLNGVVTSGYPTTVTAPQLSTNPTTINVTYPQTGYSLVANGAKGDGSPAQNPIAAIQWNEQNGDYPVSIYLIDAAGKDKVIAENIPDTGSYVWPYDATLPTGTYQIYVQVLYPAGKSGQNSATSGYFTVTKL
jgi:peptidoglycan hydrolase-like protein with peptidoglycan-binding domain